MIAVYLYSRYLSRGSVLIMSIGIVLTEKHLFKNFYNETDRIVGAEVIRVERSVLKKSFCKKIRSVFLFVFMVV